MALKDEKKEKKWQEDTNFFGTMAQIMLSALFALIGALMLFVPDMKSLYFIYVISGVLLVAGAWLLLRFFIKKGYQRITDYDFSAGLLIFVFGIVVLVRAGEMTEFFTALMGALLAVEAAILFQMTIQIVGLHGKAWLLPAVSGVLVLGVSFVLLTGYKNIFRSSPTLFYVCLFISGLLGLFSLIAAGFRSHSFKKEEKAREEAVRADVEADYCIADAPEKKPESLPETKTDALPEKEEDTAGSIPETEKESSAGKAAESDSAKTSEQETRKSHGFFNRKEKTAAADATQPSASADCTKSSAAEASTAVHSDLFTDEELRLLADNDDKK